MHPTIHARTNPEKPACIMAATGETVTYKQLDERSNQGAQLFRKLGIKTGEVIAVCMENNARYLEIAWASQRSGLYITCISSFLTASEVAYILKDCGAKLLILGQATKHLAADLPGVPQMFVGDSDGASFEAARAAMPTAPIADEASGADMLYSSGTTGRPKGVKAPLSGLPIDEPGSLVALAKGLYGLSENSIYLSPAPLYHAAPLRWCMTVQRWGGTVVVMEKFDAEKALALIEKYKINCSQWVPTHFVRLLKLPADVRTKYDHSSLRVAIHAAAPCPMPVKQQMIAWWGPVLFEYYAGTEGNGFTSITSEEWLRKQGSVGTAKMGVVKVCDENNNLLEPGNEGMIYFEGGNAFEYHNDPKKTAEATNPQGWTTLGDIGYIDADGYVFLTDRKAFMIISGGVNIYPQELENLLVTHPKVADVAVIGAPDEEMGEKVVAVIQPVDPSSADDDLRQELMAFARQHLSSIKMPKQIDFAEELPRHPTGKLYKRLLRDSYWGKTGSKIV